VDLATRSIVLEESVVPPKNRRESFTPWVVGWIGDRVFMAIPGCPESWNWNVGCDTKRKGRSYYSAQPSGRLEETVAAEGVVLKDRIVGPSIYASAGAKEYGVSFSYASGARREPLLRFSDGRLVIVKR
jgi:hypothetical protein